MFTGLIQAVGYISSHAKGVEIKEYPSDFDINIGDSVSVDGVCLTVASFNSNGFIADISEETLGRTTLGRKSIKNQKVNLELALRLSDRLGGHLVSGHVDGMAKVLSIEKLKNSWILELALEEDKFSKYICEKASVCLDGISLTVANCKNGGSVFYIAVIPHTWTNTSLKDLRIGNLLNVETDIMAKYAEKILLDNKNSTNQSRNIVQEDISTNWLISNGWN